MADNCDGRSGGIAPGITSYHFPAGTTVSADPHISSVHLGFVKEGANVLGVLAYFSVLHHSSEGGHHNRSRIFQ